MKKYIVLFLLCGFFGNAQYNLFARQNFAKSAVSGFNTEIGGVSASITSTSSLATKLGISSSRIYNFTIVGSNIKCKIIGSYAIPDFAFDATHGSPCTYYIDSDYLATSIGAESFSTTNISGIADFRNSLTVGTFAFYKTPLLTEILLKNSTSVGSGAFGQSTTLKVAYIPSCTNLGSSSGDNSVFELNNVDLKIYANPSLATNNAGGEDGDLAYARGRGAIISFVTNFTLPITPTTANIGNIYNNAIQLIDPATSTNAIDYYEVSVNGGAAYQVKAGHFITGLTTSTSYNITLKAVDIFYNKSVISSVLSVSTAGNTWDIATNLVSYYKLNETSAGRVYDCFGNKNLTNSGITINQSGKIGNSYLSTASNQNLKSTNITPITGIFSINIWCYRTANATGGNSSIIQQGGYGAGFGIWVNTSNQVGWFINTNYNNYSSLVVLPLNTWCMITLTYDGSNIKIYQNSVLKVTTANTTNPSSATTRILFNREDNNEAYIGRLDEAPIYTSALTQSQIDVLYNSGSGTTL